MDIYATSIDYDPKSELSVKFFKTVQNKMHYAAHGHTAAEVIFYLLGICFVKGKSLQEVIYKNVCMCYSGYIKK